MLSFREKREIFRLKNYFIYILSSNTGTLYIGVTNNLERRIFEHKNKLIPGFTAKYNITKLLYFEEFHEINEAIEWEKRIKKCSRLKKLDLIKSANPNLTDLAQGWFESADLSLHSR